MGNLDKLLTGDSNVVLDEAYRIAVPRQMRSVLEKNIVVLTRGGAYPCIRLYTYENFEKRIDDILQIDPDSADGVEVRRRNIVHLCELDKQGRIVIPEKLRSYAGLSRDCFVHGLYDYAEIWDKDRYIEYECSEEQYQEISERFASGKKKKEFSNDGNSAHSGSAGGNNNVSGAEGQE